MLILVIHNFHRDLGASIRGVFGNHGNRRHGHLDLNGLPISRPNLARFMLITCVSINRRWNAQSDAAMRGQKGTGADSMTDQTETKTAHIMLDGNVTPRDAAEIHDQMLQTLHAGRALVIDTTGAASVHVAILQLLVAGAAAAESRQLDFALIAPPDGACRTAFDRAGLSVPEPSPRA